LLFAFGIVLKADRRAAEPSAWPRAAKNTKRPKNLDGLQLVACARRLRQARRNPFSAIVEVLAMPEVIFTGPAGRIEGRYHQARQKNAPIAIVLHPHPQFGGTMNHQIVYQLYYAFAHRNFAVLRFNFRGVGRSQGAFDHGQGELSDAASALDWAQSLNPEARSCWIAGFSFGSWIGMQLLMRRPEIEGFISICPPANLYDFSFLAPCPSSGLIIHGDKDAVVPAKDVTGLVEKLKTQRGIVIDQKIVPGANHFFDGKIEALMQAINLYLDKRLKGDRKTSAA
jgi:alpha/beta superfamily hydrolase